MSELASGPLVVAWDEALTQYDFGPGHPLAPVRVALTMELAAALGVLAAPSVTMISPSPATDAELETVHDEDYVAAVRQAGRTLAPDLRFGLGTSDDPVFEGMHEASALVAGATLAAAKAIWPGRPGQGVHAASIAGGLHHAMRRSASGFCVYNDPAIAIRWLLSAGVERVAYVDTDVHHGDGVQAAFYDDPRVLTISLHEHPATLFPGTGLPGETGTGEGEGYAVNVALPAGTGDAGAPALHAASIAGGLHHAMRRSASGFCVYNDPAIAIRWLLSAGAERVAYVDTDVHHGDGVQAAFYDDPRVLTISLHEHPATLFPGTGLPGETGAGAGEGYAVNVALPAGTGDAGWLRAFKPTVLVSQHGCDSHRLDPLAHLELTVDGQRRAQVMLHDLAHELCDGRWLLTGGGGYALVQVVPRTWTHLLAIAAGAPVDPETETPAAWRELARSLTGETAPATMTDGAPANYVPFSSGADPGDPVDRAIMRTRTAVFASHGLVAHL